MSARTTLPGLRPFRLRCSGRLGRRQLRPFFAIAHGEIRQSTRILEQALIRSRPVRCNATTRASRMPPKTRGTTPSKGMIGHFKIIVDGIPRPRGEVYSYTEGGNGELRVLHRRTARVARRTSATSAACFIIMQSLSKMIHGLGIADIIPDLRHDQHDRRRVRPPGVLAPGAWKAKPMAEDPQIHGCEKKPRRPSPAPRCILTRRPSNRRSPGPGRQAAPRGQGLAEAALQNAPM